MVECSKIRCFGFSYEEVEDIIREWNSKAEAKYVGRRSNCSGRTW